MAKLIKDIAIVGIGARLPQCDNYHEFWQKLRNGHNFLSKIPASRWSNSVGDNSCKFGSFIQDIYSFDYEFFGITKEEVMIMDPQERIAMETVWSCIEDAGYRPEQLGKNVSLYTGVTYTEHQKHIMFSTHSYMINNRISYFFDFQGRNVTVDAGCCSALAALEQACADLSSGKEQLCIVTGLNAVLHPDHFAGLSEMMNTGTEGVSKPFGKSDGWFPAEGAITFMLKPLQAALTNRDNVHGVIKSSVIEQEGRTSWFRASNPLRHAEMIKNHFITSGIHPETIGYVEMAANGSAFGDAIEFEGAVQAFQELSERCDYWPVGSVKSLIGHGESVSTFMQILKVLLQFCDKILLPVDHIDEINGGIQFLGSPFYLQNKKDVWRRINITIDGNTHILPLRATVSSFGSGGNMGHVILEESTLNPVQAVSLPIYLLPFSSATEDQLKETIRACKDELMHNEFLINDIMFTLCSGRADFQYKTVFLTSNLIELKELFEDYLDDKVNNKILVQQQAQEELSKPQELVCTYDKYIIDPLTFAKAWLSGFLIKWNSFFEEIGARKCSFPGFSFNRLSVAQPSSEQKVVKKEERIQQEDLLSAKILEILSDCFGCTLNKNMTMGELALTSMKIAEATEKLSILFPMVRKTLFFSCKSVDVLIQKIKADNPKMKEQEVVSGNMKMPDFDWLADQVLNGTISIEKAMDRLSEKGY